VALVGIGIVLGIAGSRIWWGPGRAWLPALAVGLAIVWWQLQREDNAAAAGSTTAATAAAPTGVTPTMPAAPPRLRFPIFLPAVGLMISGAGVLAILQATDTVDVDWTLALAGGVVLVGLAVAVGAFVGGVGALAAVGVVMAAILVAVATIDVPLRGPVGDRTVHPTTLHALDDRYRQSIGDLELDLSDLSLPAGATRGHATVGIGHLEVIVPPKVRVEAHGEASAGEVSLFGSDESGWDVDRTVVDQGTTTNAPVPTLVLHTDIGLGQVEVRRG
jgi:hypothetical protein